MLNVLLVDDEPLALTHLKRLIDWETHGFRICGEAYSGQEAAAMLPVVRPNIVIADIDMPGMDGVSLSKHIRDHWDGQVKLVILSSYDNYEYVRETMKNGASDYLLKHRAHAEGMLELLLRLKEDIRQSESKPDGLAFMERHWPALNRGLAQTYLRSLVLGREEDAAQAAEYFRRLSPVRGGRAVIAALQTSDMQESLGKRTASELAQREKTITDVIRQSLEQCENGIVTDLGQGRFAVLFAFAEERSEHAILQRVRVCMQRMLDMLRMYVNVHLSYGIGPVSDRLDQLAADYASASSAREGAAPDSADAADGTPNGLTLRQEKALIAAMDEGEPVAVSVLLADIFTRLKEMKASGLSAALPHTVHELMQLADKIWSKSGNGINAVYYEGEWPTRQELADPARLDEVASWIKSLYAQLWSKLEEARREREHSPYVRQAITFIRERFAEPVTLEMAADEAGITDTYMGRLFKQETGIYFTDYLNSIRIKAAKQLIDSGDYRAKDIFERVGFTGYSYFFKVFKSQTGMTPQEYAKRKR